MARKRSFFMTRGETAQALDEARQALKAAGVMHSGFQRHPKIGPATDISNTFGAHIKEIRASLPGDGGHAGMVVCCFELFR